MAYMEVKSAELEAYRANLRRGKAEVSSQLREEEKSNNQLVHNQSTQWEIVSKIGQITKYKSKNKENL